LIEQLNAGLHRKLARRAIGSGLQVWYVAAGLLCGVTGVALFFMPAIVNIEENNNNGASAKAKLLAPAEG